MRTAAFLIVFALCAHPAYAIDLTQTEQRAVYCANAVAQEYMPAGARFTPALPERHKDGSLKFYVLGQVAVPQEHSGTPYYGPYLWADKGNKLGIQYSKYPDPARISTSSYTANTHIVDIFEPARVLEKYGSFDFSTTQIDPDIGDFVSTDPTLDYVRRKSDGMLDLYRDCMTGLIS